MTRKEEEGFVPPVTPSLFNLRETFSRLELSRSEEEEEEEEQELRALFSSAHDEESSHHSSDDVLVFLETKTKKKDFDESKGEDDLDDDDEDKEDKENADDLLVDDEDDDDESSLPSCAICLTAPALENSCFTVPCLHSFCARCIVRWANFQEEEENEQRKKRGLSSTHHQHHRHGSGGGSSFAAKCPSCRVPFENLLCYRELDGSVHKLRGELDLREHPLCLLKRSKWLGLEKDEDEMHGTRRSSYEEDSFEEEDRRDFHRYHQMKSSNNKSPAYYDDIDDEYFAKRGGARVVIGNRRFGANGFVASGRALARPIQQPSVKKEKMRAAAFSSSPSNQHSMTKMKASPTTKITSASPPTPAATAKGALLGTTPPLSSSTPAPKGKKSMKKQLKNEKKRLKDQEKAARRLATRKEYQRKVPIEDSQPRMAEGFKTEEEEEEEEEEEIGEGSRKEEEGANESPRMVSSAIVAEVIM